MAKRKILRRKRTGLTTRSEYKLKPREITFKIFQKDNTWYAQPYLDAKWIGQGGPDYSNSNIDVIIESIKNDYNHIRTITVVDEIFIEVKERR